MMSLADLHTLALGGGHSCLAPTRKGLPCHRLVPTPFRHCPWHRQDQRRPDRRRLAQQLAAFLAEYGVETSPMPATSGWSLIVAEPNGGRLLVARWCGYVAVDQKAIAVWLRKLPKAPRGWGRELWILTPDGWQGHATLAGRGRTSGKAGKTEAR